MSFIEELKKATQPHFSLLSDEVRAVETYLLVEWIFQLTQREQSRIISDIKCFAENARRLPGDRLSINEVFTYSIKKLLVETKYFPILTAALIDAGVSENDLGEVIFQLMLRGRIQKEAPYLGKLIGSLRTTPGSNDAGDWVLAIESGYKVYERFVQLAHI